MVSILTRKFISILISISIFVQKISFHSNQRINFDLIKKIYCIFNVSKPISIRKSIFDF